MEAVVTETEPLWWQIIMPDPDNTTGSSTAKLLSDLLHRCPVGFVAVLGANWLARLLTPLYEPTEDGFVALADQLVTQLPSVVQVDWATFCLCAREDTANQLLNKDKLHRAVAMSDFAVSVVDNSFFYLYVQDEDLFKQVLNEQVLTEKHRDLLSKFLYPY